jgi:macrolide-specific efflux system membrane fusion protein
MAAALAGADAPPPTQPTTSPAAPTHVVKKGRISLKIDATGAFLPASPTEIRVRPDAFKGELTIVSAAAHGATVKKGDTILQVDATDLNRELDSARNDLTTAKANHAKAESDATLGEKSDALAMKMAEVAAKKGETDLKWWDDLTGPQMLQQTDLMLKQMQAFLEDQGDELEQLKKMYKTEDLTSATADIVLKRAVRQYEIGKINVKMQEELAKKTKGYDQPQSRTPLEFAVEQAKQALEQLKATQAHGKITRQTALKSAQLALAAAEKRVADLEKDLPQLTVAAPSDGVVLYGQLAEGVLQSVDPKTMRAKEKLPPGQTVMVLFAPGSMKLAFDLPESKLAWVKKGMKAKVTPVAWPELSYDGTLAAPAPVGKASGAEQTFQQVVELGGVDARILPGMKAMVKIDAGQGDELPLAPVAAVNNGKVHVKTKDGKEEEREVVTGRSDGTSVEIRQGVQEGDELLLGAKS